MSEPAPPLRLLSWNVRHLFGDPLAVRRVLRAASPDVVCLQESPRVPWAAWSLASLARSTGLIHVAGGWSGGGTAILSSPRVVVRDPEAFRFPLTRRNSQRRGATLVSVGRPGASAGPFLRVAGIHLGTEAEERLDHTRQLLERLSVRSGPVTGPVAVAGDLNEPPGGPAWQAFSAVVTDPAPGAPVTFPAARPRRRIDAVLTGAGVSTLEYGQWAPDRRDAELASDHLPVLALLSF